ncbi:MAG: family 43 glycosylhydrolase [Actinomycetota bacterium]|nr:family 43 glycosylhydrolase [Actinomycetota bacterium]
MAQPLHLADPGRPGLAIVSSGTMDLPDPFVLLAMNHYYLYVSTAFGSPLSMNVPVMMTSQSESRGLSQSAPRLAQWGQPHDALPILPLWAVGAGSGGRVWAPNVIRIGDVYTMYFAPTLKDGPTPITHCIGVSTASTPSGPFTPIAGPPLVCQLSQGGDIDPQVFVDPDGPMGAQHPYYLLWKSDNNLSPRYGPDTAWAAPLRNDGLALSGPAVPILQVHQAWEQPFLEAPQMVSAPDGSDWLLFSTGAGFWKPGSAIGLARCDGPLGPCQDFLTSPLIGSNEQGVGPGEETVFVSDKADVWVLYSPWHTGTLSPFRPVEAAHLAWVGGRPVLLAPEDGPFAG